MTLLRDLIRAPLWGALFVILMPFLGLFVLLDVLILDPLKVWRKKRNEKVPIQPDRNSL